MPRANPPDIQGPEAFLRTLRDPGRNLRERYRDDPLSLADRFGLRFPKKPVATMVELGIITPEEAKVKFGPDSVLPGLRDLVLDVCLGHEDSAVAVANRGGGKSVGVSFIEFYLVWIRSFDALNLGGSELQADIVYRYLLGYLDDDPYWLSLVQGDPLRERTTLEDGNWIKVLTASHKSVRGHHAGGPRRRHGRTIMRGGVLVIDEEAETDEEIVSAAMFTINTARPSVSVRCSTFHNVEGSFAEVVDNHEEMGYKLYKWDVFDVCERCDCVNTCQSPEPCFREDHVEEVVNPDTGQTEERLIHLAYCGGKAMYADGWISMEEIEKMWKRMKRNHISWEVEAMGSRPSSSGYVIRDQKKFSENVVDVPAATLYMKGFPVSVLVDWGTVAAGVEVWQEQPGDKHVLLEADLMEEAGQSQIFGAILGYREKYSESFLEAACDIGGGGNYLNPKLREEYLMQVRDVNFAEEKENAVAALNIYNEAGNIIIPAEHEDFIRQIRRWKRKNGRIQKGNDHLCDAAICYFAKFQSRLGLRKIRILPKVIAAGNPQDSFSRQENGRRPGGGSKVAIRRPIMRAIGGNRGR